MLSIQTNVSDDTATLKLTGRLDVTAAREADSSFEQAASESKNVVLDLEELDYIASAGLRAVKRLRVAVQKNGGALSVTNVQDNVMEVFEMTGFAAMLVFI